MWQTELTAKVAWLTSSIGSDRPRRSRANRR
jgi:hypothetical protein